MYTCASNRYKRCSLSLIILFFNQYRHDDGPHLEMCDRGVVDEVQYDSAHSSFLLAILGSWWRFVVVIVLLAPLLPLCCLGLVVVCHHDCCGRPSATPAACYPPVILRIITSVSCRLLVISMLIQC